MFRLSTQRYAYDNDTWPTKEECDQTREDRQMCNVRPEDKISAEERQTRLKLKA